MRSSAALTSLAPERPRLAWAATFKRRADIRFQVLDYGLDRRQLGLGVLLECTPQPHEQLTDLALVVGLAATEREGCPERLAYFLQQLLERAAPFRRGALNVVALQALAGSRQHAARFVFRRARSGGMAPRRELDLSPRRCAAAQVFEKLLVVRQDDQLPVGKPVGEQLGEPPAMLDVEAVDHVVENQESQLLVEARRHGQEQGNRERVQM